MNIVKNEIDIYYADDFLFICTNGIMLSFIMKKKQKKELKQFLLSLADNKEFVEMKSGNLTFMAEELDGGTRNVFIDDKDACRMIINLTERQIQEFANIDQDLDN